MELPQLAVPTLSLLANYGADHRVRLHWEWHYKSGKLVTAQPLWRHPGDHGYRDDPAEARILDAVGQPWDVVPALGESATGGWGTPRLAASAELSGLDTLAFTEELLPRLREVPGVTVDTAGEIADYREAEEAPVVSISTKATEQRDSFDLGIQISLEGQPVSFAAVFSALAAGQTKMLLPSGAYFSLDLPNCTNCGPSLKRPGNCRTTRTPRCRSAASRPGSGTTRPTRHRGPAGRGVARVRRRAPRRGRGGPAAAGHAQRGAAPVPVGGVQLAQFPLPPRLGRGAGR